LIDSILKNNRGVYIEAFGKEIISIFRAAYLTVFPDEKLRQEFKRVISTWKGGLFPESIFKELQGIIDRAEPKSKLERNRLEKEDHRKRMTIKSSKSMITEDNRSSMDSRYRPFKETQDISSSYSGYSMPTVPYYEHTPVIHPPIYTYPDNIPLHYPTNYVYPTESYMSYDQQQMIYSTASQPLYPSSMITMPSLSSELNTLLASTVPITMSFQQQQPPLQTYENLPYDTLLNGPIDLSSQLNMVLKRLGLLNVSNHLEKLTTSVRCDGAINLLYELLQLQCRICALRFEDTEKGKRAMAEHLDWHYRRNKRLKERLKRPFSRGWFLSEKVRKEK
jgi:pre-mRNA cleavage complex 2 protein Pcf11